MSSSISISPQSYDCLYKLESESQKCCKGTHEKQIIFNVLKSRACICATSLLVVLNLAKLCVVYISRIVLLIIIKKEACEMVWLSTLMFFQPFLISSGVVSVKISPMQQKLQAAALIDQFATVSFFCLWKALIMILWFHSFLNLNNRCWHCRIVHKKN